MLDAKPLPASVKSVALKVNGFVVLFFTVPPEVAAVPSALRAPDVGTVMSLVRVNVVVTVFPALSEPTMAIVGDEDVGFVQVRALAELKVWLGHAPLGDESVLVVKVKPVLVPLSDGNVMLKPQEPPSTSTELRVVEPAALPL